MTPITLNSILLTTSNLVRSNPSMESFSRDVAELVTSYERLVRDNAKMLADLKHAKGALERVADQLTAVDNDIAPPIVAHVAQTYELTQETAKSVVTDALEGVAELLRNAEPSEVIFDGNTY